MARVACPSEDFACECWGYADVRQAAVRDAEATRAEAPRVRWPSRRRRARGPRRAPLSSPWSASPASGRSHYYVPRRSARPFFEATPPGAESGPPVKTGARVRRFRGCNSRVAARCLYYL